MFLSNESVLVAAKSCLLLLFVCTGCRQDMADQPRFEPLEASEFFADGKSARPLVAGTVPRGHLQVDQTFYVGSRDGNPVTDFPLGMAAKRLGLLGDEQQLMSQVIRRGQQRFNIFCAGCHDRTGSGRGMVVQRGFPAPPSLHIQRLRDAPVGHIYDVISSGFGRMPDHASQIRPADRWAVVAYVRALQLSQHADVSSLPASDREALTGKETSP